MATCAYSSFVGGSCGPGRVNISSECVPVGVCNKDVKAHLRGLNVSDSTLETEAQLLLSRAGIFEFTEIHMAITICPRHRELYGTRWRCNKKSCTTPTNWAPHKSRQVKGERGITYIQSKELFYLTNYLVVIGSPICKQCRTQLKSLGIASRSPELLPNLSDGTTDLAKEPQNKATQTTPSKDSCQHSPGDFVERRQLQGDESDMDLTAAFSGLSIKDYTDEDFPEITSSSSESDESGFNLQVLRRQKLNQLLSVCGKKESLCCSQPRKPWEEMSRQSKNVYVRKATAAIAASLEVVTPEDPKKLWEAVLSTHSVEKALGITASEQRPEERKYLEELAETYQNAASWNVRRQILAIIADKVPFSEMKKLIPGITEYRCKTARQHALQYGRGSTVPLRKSPKMRVDENQLDHFLTFITSPHVIQDLPFGQRYLHLANGQVLEVPSVIRTMIPKRIIQQYNQICEESGLKPLSPSTIYRVLSVCTATVRKSLQGLDYFSADGAKAFDDLAALATRLENHGIVDKEWVRYCEESLKAGKQYIKTEYKVHLTEASNIADHCIMYSLSDSKEKHFRKVCDHVHDKSCSSCEGLKSVLSSITTTIQSNSSKITEDEYDDMMYSCRQATQAIQAWKTHQVRSLQQDKCRIDVLGDLQDNDILITQDWAMKFLPHKYRESQADWYGKRGISWHISVIVRKKADGTVQHQTFVHIAENCTQDSDAVVAIMEDTLRNLKNEYPEITTASFRQDNAGCYHSAAMLTACHLISKRTGLQAKRIDFSDPQGGKGPCDRKASTIKAHVRRYINEGHDVTKASELRDAILSNGGVHGVRVTLFRAEKLVPINPAKWDGISSLNNFLYEDDKVTVWKAYDIGQGKPILWSTLQVPAVLQNDLNCEMSPGKFVDISTPSATSAKKTHLPHGEAEEPSDSYQTTSKLFACPVDGCIAQFQRHSSLENHLQYGKCKIVTERENLFDKAKIMYKDKLLQGSTSHPVLTSVTQIPAPEKEELVQGWALKTNKKNQRFTERQKSYLQEKFLIGQQTGKKLDPESVAQGMRYARDEAGNRRFTMEEFLTPKQSQSFFSRTAANLKKGSALDERDIYAAEEESNYQDIRTTILKECQLSHPIVFDSFNLCHLRATNGLKKLSVAMLQHVCEYFDLDTTGFPVKRKAPYIDVIANMVKSCNA